MLKLIVIEVKQEFVYGVGQGKKTEWWGIEILRKYMCFPEFGDERYAIQKIKTGMHGCVQLGAYNWWDVCLCVCVGGGGG